MNVLSHFRSADFNSNNGYCYLNKGTKDTVPKSYVYGNGWVYLQRTCKPEGK